nr:type II toxin-antitoxin system prevent-host-death family antitoxin [Chloroflexus sp.]
MSGQPVVITQKGYPSAVLLNIELFEQLRALAMQAEKAREQNA